MPELRAWFSQNKLVHTSSVVLVVGLSILVVMLLLQNQDLRSRLANSSKRERLQETLSPGESPPPLKVITLLEDTLTIDLGSSNQPSIVFFLSIACRVCGESIPAWNEIAINATPLGWQVLYVSIYDVPGTRYYVKEKNIPSQVYVAKDTTVRDSYKIGLVPQTLIFDDLGTVRGQWSGLVDSTNEAAIIAAITDLEERRSRD